MVIISTGVWWCLAPTVAVRVPLAGRRVRQGPEHGEGVLPALPGVRGPPEDAVPRTQRQPKPQPLLPAGGLKPSTPKPPNPNP